MNCERSITRQGDAYDRTMPTSVLNCGAVAVGRFKGVWLCSRCHSRVLQSLMGSYSMDDARFRERWTSRVEYVVLQGGKKPRLRLLTSARGAV